MNRYVFNQQDFDVFNVEGLEPRMQALIEIIRPKLNHLGDLFAPYLTEMLGETFYAHVAKHARRKTNPPKDTWVAFSTNKRGYKMLPHFQIGLWQSQVFIYFGVIYESPDKVIFAEKLEKNFKQLRTLPHNFTIKGDHMKEDYAVISELSDEQLQHYITRLSTVKKAELLIGLILTPDEIIQLNDEQFIQLIEQTFDTLANFY